MSERIRYSRLGYATLQVTDLERSTAFYRDQVGLVAEPGDAGSTWLRCSDKPYDLILRQGEAVGLAEVGFEVEATAELDKAHARLAARGYTPAWADAAHCEARKVERALHIVNPDTGLRVELYTAQALADVPFEPSVAQITRLGHVVLNVASYADAHRFWVEDLGFAISDHVPGQIAFLRCWPNTLHHSVALLEGAEDGLNHVNFMVTDIDDIGRGMNRRRKADAPIVFGPGRHLPSTSIFLYFLDPDGLTAEYSFGMEEIEAEGGREPRDLEPKPEVLDTWGSIPDPRFGKTGRIVASHG